VDPRTYNSLVSRWNRLRGRSYALDLARAIVIWDAFIALDEDVDALRDWIIVALQEYPGKRTESLIRMGLALEVNDYVEDWHAIGGKAMSLLVRIQDSAQRDEVLEQVEETMTRTGRGEVSDQTFRNILRLVLGDAGYADVRLERRDAGESGVFTDRQQVKHLRADMLRLLRRGRITVRDLSEPSRVICHLTPTQRGTGPREDRGRRGLAA
jgi:hypothetical protein